MQPHEAIAGHELILARFGRWPSFHDGEIHTLVLDSTRHTHHGRRYPSIELTARGWNLTTQVTADGIYKTEADSVVRFLFEHVYDVELDGLNHQNVLSSIDLSFVEGEKQATHLAVELVHCFGLSGSFKAASAKVVSVTPYEAPRAA